MSSGSHALSASASLRVDILIRRRGSQNVRTMPSAWTPVSVRLALVQAAAPAGNSFASAVSTFFLHARAGFLHLPAFVSRAVVGNNQFEFPFVHKKKLTTDGHGWTRIKHEFRW